MKTAPRVDQDVAGVTTPATARIVLAIARVEGTRMVRHPLFVLAALAAIPVIIVQTTGDAPVLHRDDAYTGSSLYLLAAVILLLTNIATLRRRRSGTADIEDARPTSQLVLSGGLLVSVVWAVLAALFIVGVEIAVLRGMGGIWAPSVRELLVGPSMVGALGSLGVALGRWFPSGVSGPLALVALAALEIWLSAPMHSTDPQVWLGLWPEVGFLARELAFRPVGWHVLYLAGFAMLFCSIALMRHGLGARRGIVAAVSLAAIVGGALAQVRSDAVGSGASAFYQRAADQAMVCRSVEDIRYCALRAYEDWIPRWARVLGGVRSVLSAEPRSGIREVRQTLDEFAVHLDPRRGTLWVGPDWGRFSRAGEFEFALGLSAAELAVGLPGNGIAVDQRLTRAEAEGLNTALGSRSYGVGDVVTYRHHCKAPRQARTVTALWLAARATPGSEAAVRRLLERQPWGFYRDPDGEGVRFGGGLETLQGGAFGGYKVVPARSDLVRAVQMLDGGERIEPIVRRHWRSILDPTTTADELSAMLGLEPLPDLSAQLDATLQGQRPIVEQSTRRQYGRYIASDGGERIPRLDGPQLRCP